MLSLVALLVLVLVHHRVLCQHVHMDFKVKDFVGVMYMYEVVYSRESWWYTGLNSHGALWRNCKNHETMLEDAKDSFNDILS
jgi:hypothetical protein